MPIPTKPSASIVICTHNRAADLERACRRLVDLTAKSQDFEILVVDSGSTDETRSVATALTMEVGGRLRLIQECKAGLSLARNSAVRDSRGDVVVFVDDDAVPSALWLGELLREFEDPRVWAAGGPVVPRISGRYPPWFSARFLPYLSAWDLGAQPKDLTYNNYPRGTNIAFRREVFERLGLFLPQLGRKGHSLRSCEEIELCLRIERAGRKIRYIPTASVLHHVEVTRLSQAWLVKRFKAQGFSEAIMEWCHAGLAGLRIGLIRAFASTRRRRQGTSSTEILLARCFEGALVGYLVGSSYAVFSIRRWVPIDRTLAVTRWHPSS